MAGQRLCEVGGGWARLVAARDRLAGLRRIAAARLPEVMNAAGAIYTAVGRIWWGNECMLPASPQSGHCSGSRLEANFSPAMIRPVGPTRIPPLRSENMWLRLYPYCPVRHGLESIKEPDHVGLKRFCRGRSAAAIRATVQVYPRGGVACRPIAARWRWVGSILDFRSDSERPAGDRRQWNGGPAEADYTPPPDLNLDNSTDTTARPALLQRRE